MDSSTLVSQAIPLSKDISDEDDEWLIRDAMEDEIRQAVTQILPLKNPSPSGMQAIFYQKCWPVNICLMIKGFLKYGHLLKEFNKMT